MKKLFMLLIVGWMSMTAVYSQFTAGFYGVQPQIVAANSPATIEFRFDGDSPVDFSFFDGVSWDHRYHISNSPYFFTVTPSETTCYELRVVKNRYGNGVILDDYRFVTVIVNNNAPDNVQMFFSPPDICKNEDPINLRGYFSSNVVPERVWFEGDGVFEDMFYPESVNVGSYTLKALMFYDGSTYSTQRNVAVFESPQVTLWLPSEVFLNEPPFVLSGGRPSGGTYSTDLGDYCIVNGNIFDPGQAGVGWHNVYYTYTTISGCQDVAEAKIYVRMSGNDVEETVEDSFAVYPNPTQGVVRFSEPCSVDVFSTMCLVRRENSLVGSIDISDLPNGIYVLRLSNGENYFIKRIVKE